MPQVYNDRLNACNKLESAETTLLKTAAKIRAEKIEKQEKNPDSPENIPGEESPNVEHDLTLADKLVPRDQRPTHRLPIGFLPFGLPLIGKKVDSIDWAKEEIVRTNEELTEMQKALAKEVGSMTKSSRLFNMSLREMSKELDKQTYPPLNSAFILFNNQMAAHMAVRLLTHHEPYRMAKKYVDVAPEDIVWGNLSMNPYEAQVRTLISYAITAVLVSCFLHRPLLPDLIFILLDHLLGNSSIIHRFYIERLKAVCDLPLA
jgi:calcium permeable stress-gated cation channel